MLSGSTALIVSGGGGTDLALRKALNEAGVQVRIVGSCAEARQVLAGAHAPIAVFSDAILPDGSWMDVLAVAEQGGQEVPVIVVSRVLDINLYMDALEKGAADLIVPPFHHQNISDVLKCAARIGAAVQSSAAD